MTLCFASNNPHKLEEVRAIVGTSFSILSLKDIGCHEELPETHDTIAGNAKEKAGFVWEHFRIPCFADDSGLEVDALQGRPGADSAHFAGPQRNSGDNIRLLLNMLGGVENRSAQFKTVISIFLAEGNWQFEGILKGTIRKEPSGTNGFGYDPVFQPAGSGRTIAEMTLEEKNRISHRALAVRKLADFLAKQ